MANAAYDNLKRLLLDAAFNFEVDTAYAALISSAYTFNAADAVWSDIAGNAIGTPQIIGSKARVSLTETGGDITFTGVSAALTVKAIVVFFDTGGVDGDLLLYLDTGAGLPLTTTGNDITVRWNNTTPTGDVFGF